MRPSGDRTNRKDGHSPFSTLARSCCDDREKECSCSLSKLSQVCFRKSTVHFCQVRHTCSFCGALANEGFHIKTEPRIAVCVGQLVVVRKLSGRFLQGCCPPQHPLQRANSIGRAARAQASWRREANQLPSRLFVKGILQAATYPLNTLPVKSLHTLSNAMFLWYFPHFTVHTY